jgi:RNA polymerase sigma factor (TIGR02999 family)
VNEAYLRLVRVRPQAWENRAQFFALTAQIMRRNLVDHARARVAQQRGGGAPHVELDAGIAAQPRAASLVSLDEALLGLERLDPRKSRLIELRVFAGLTNAEAAEALGTSERTVHRDWQFVKAWLARELNHPASGAD